MKLLFASALVILLFFPIQANAAQETVTVTAIVGGDDEGGAGYAGGVRSGIRFSGYAYPGAFVQILKNTKNYTSVVSDDKGYFTITIDEEYNSTALYSLYATDKNGERSLLLNYPLLVQEGYLTHISNILFAPTFLRDKIEVKQGDFITFYGYGLPRETIEIEVMFEELVRTYTLKVPNDGSYKLTIPLSGYERGEYSSRASYKIENKRYSSVKRFVIGIANISRDEASQNIPGDCNVDQRVSIIDFSIAAFWYGKKNPPLCADSNSDGTVNLIDFSILAYYWTN